MKSNDVNKKSYIKIATELCYGDKVVEALKKAKTDDECLRIMETARQRSSDQDVQRNIEQMRKYNFKKIGGITW